MYNLFTVILLLVIPPILCLRVINYIGEFEEYERQVFILKRLDKTPIMRRFQIFNGPYHIYNFHKWRKMPPEEFYNCVKKQLCGDPFGQWQQALKEANTLRLENLRK